jgi:hypothetical protein
MLRRSSGGREGSIDRPIIAAGATPRMRTGEVGHPFGPLRRNRKASKDEAT